MRTMRWRLRTNSKKETTSDSVSALSANKSGDKDLHFRRKRSYDTKRKTAIFNKISVRREESVSGFPSADERRGAKKSFALAFEYTRTERTERRVFTGAGRLSARINTGKRDNGREHSRTCRRRNISLAGRYNDAEMRRDSQCGKLASVRLFCAMPSLHRQRYPHLCGRATAA